ncbi:HelD family protein [Clostridium aminobutyricum]|uniref:DNA 3'-5' helicase n=1 Tax=Clostridium aminobutyricum TaxID=33953 RepID=A0A939D8V2_CLOAM|nr:3'-5' exonuclease [Clostridium aminobutyricum]MBN7772848.1 AAA family ATPase [Clostridium aminobutyricum]
MENYEVEFDFEVKHLRHIITIAEKQLSVIRQNSSRQQSDIIEAKKELWENSSHSISNLWSKDSFYELIALNQYANSVSSKLSTLELGANKMMALEKTVQSPYFARIDFQFEGENEVDQIYIGRTSLIDETDVQIYVYDWRSPLASVFYRFGVGKAFYDAPNGRISGEVSLKRQFEIHHGVLEYFFDADVQIMDEFLRKLLSQNASSKMKAIVETIQKDQDIVIRDIENDLMMVQGVAGSGKTSVALHRVAYLMYQGLSSKLSAHNIMIISPNTLFERYISNVLPELGEDNVVSVNFDDMLKTILPSMPIQNRHQFLESLLTCKSEDSARLMKKSLEFKASTEFKEILDRFMDDIPRKWIEFSDIDYDGKCIASRTLLKAEILDRKKAVPLGLRLKQLEESIFKKVHEMRKVRMKKLRDFVINYKEHIYEVEEFSRLLSISESTVLLQKIERFTKLDILSLYKELFHDPKYFHRLAAGIQLPDDIDHILNFTQENMKRGQLSFEDGLVLAFLQLKLYGFQYGNSIKQVVIDEAQDYYPLHFELLKTLFPQARYTILGDIYQTIEKPEEVIFFDRINKILDKKKSALITMNKSFRCTNEILNFSKKFLQQDSEIESFSRKGEVPEIYEAQDQEEFDELVIREIRFCKEAEYQSIGLLCKTEKDAISLYHRLKEQLAIRFIGSDTITNIKGVFVLPLYMAKGLEFDAVLLCDTNKEHYSTEDDKKLLYIGCTRALHRLSLFYTGEKSPLLY